MTSAFSLFTYNEEITGIESRKVPLYQGGYNQKILYISGMAMGISKSQNSPTMEIAQAIAVHLSQNSDSLFRVKVVPPGEIHIELVDSTLAAWLHDLTVRENGDWRLGQSEQERIKISVPNYQLTSSLKIFTIQHAHARCCSLLLLGHQEGLIELQRTSIKSFISVKSIPWLNNNQKLCLNHADESFLIHQLVKVVDDLVFAHSSSTINWEKAAGNLSQAVERFWCNCRIWGEVKIHDPELAQARLGLLIATQLVLRWVLEGKLGIVAPVEL
ncbi:MAG: DALR anticodon-binding domain-containing protein [Dolichospermum sp.]|uniref:DALR anticodon-binding domain-containing protein n=1 Tax=Anabaena sp. UHCC 0187 TaxID=2590018 RepID=UPI00157FC417|nr:DALR anticodon-binding domain-containing protein [Anabaena sp. UHCC 0187]MDP5018895.1 DALR anticodon-binding domain-containing protein [Dolichospermum sp.]